jgi:hypothetical protein
MANPAKPMIRHADTHEDLVRNARGCRFIWFPTLKFADRDGAKSSGWRLNYITPPGGSHPKQSSHHRGGRAANESSTSGH